MVEVDERFLSLIDTDKVSIDVIRVVADDMVIELAVLQHIVGIEGDVCLHMLLSPLSGYGNVLPVEVSD